jgi:endonuclease/exonuclease/phosphatase (EEP) superfamily protein YafD
VRHLKLTYFRPKHVLVLPHQRGKASVAEKVAGRLDFSVYFAESPDAIDRGLAIVSRFPLLGMKTERLRSCNLRFRNRKRFAIAATVQTPWEEVRIWNGRLDTRINVQERLEQLQPVLDGAARHAGPQLISGDFNTNGLYWLGNVLPLPWELEHIPATRSAMRQHGFASPLPDELITCPQIRRHLDWLFVRGLQSLEPVPSRLRSRITKRFGFAPKSSSILRTC